jgi:glycosyltransferase involved in cell wall biosynthesis
VIIPTLNEEAFILPCLESVMASAYVKEAIVVDAGSRDATLARARSTGARCLSFSAPPGAGGGRGGQIRAGLAMATGDLVAVVHADTRVPAGIFRTMIRVLNTRRDVIGGAVGCRFDTADSDPATRVRCGLVGFLNHVRVLVSGISFGDQVQFFRREPVVSMDLFPAIPLMEDVELSLRLRSLGRLTYLNLKVPVSPRRWQHKGSGNALLIMGLFFLYLLLRPWTRSDSSFFYRTYYGRSIP